MTEPGTDGAETQVRDDEDLSAQVFVAGAVGSGKSVLMKDIVWAHIQETPDRRFVAWDTTGEWKPIKRRLIVLSDWDYPDGEEAAWLALEKFAPCTFVCDELDRLAPNQGASLPRGTAIYEIVHRGRHWRCGLMGGARSLPNVHRDITRQAYATGGLFFYRISEPRDLEWLRKVDGVGESGAQEIAKLPDFTWKFVSAQNRVKGKETAQ